MANYLSTRKLLSVLIIPFLLTSEALSGWEYISDGYLGSVYVDFETIERKGRMVTGWQLQNLKGRAKSGALSRRILLEVDCKEQKRRIIYLSTHSEPLGKGTVLYTNRVPTKWAYPIPKSLGSKVIKMMCEGGK
ncbi:MAG: hypothetical protein CBC42_07645 [Betaproteobacteria bacterium TMED82]|nr:MAG: hypothetical protein CBC42_07645 [Betaproteobacteria bacterium TMED82]|tara:strand:- start:119 stop:520 length:402 start_codon:yes stop_codon:yes gene_type:complete